MKHLSMDEYIRTIENIQDGVLSVFLGAGASIQSGVPSAGDMVWEFKRKLYCTANKISEEYYKDLQSEITKTSLQNFFDGLTGFPTYGDGQEYSFYFEKCYPSIEARREYIYNKLSEKKPSIGYLCLGSLVNQKIIRTVLTTNFDPLIESGIKSINPLQQIVAISSSLNPQASIIESIPQIIKMHGDYLYDRIQNTAEELQKLERHIGQLSATRLSDNQLLVIGYSGNDSSILDWFKSNLDNPSFASKGIYWCTIKNYGVNEKVAHLLEGIEQRGREVGIIEISNFDDFLYRVYASKCTAESTILKLGEAQSKLEPFVFSSTPRKKPFIKYNAFISKQDGIPKTIRCAKTSIANYNNKRHDIMFQAFLEHNQPTDTPVAVLEGVDALKPHMERKDIFKCHRFLAVILIEQPFHLRRHFLGQGRFPSADLIRQLFIIADGKPIFPCIARSGFQDKMQVLDEFLAELRFCALDDLVNTAEVIGGFDDIVHPHAFLGNADGVGFKNKARLIMGQAAALHVIGVIGELHLHLMINSAVGLTALFLFKNIRQSLRCGPAFIAPFRLLGVFGNVPGLTRQKSAGDATCRAVVADAALGGIPKRRYLFYG